MATVFFYVRLIVICILLWYTYTLFSAMNEVIRAYTTSQQQDNSNDTCIQYPETCIQYPEEYKL